MIREIFGPPLAGPYSSPRKTQISSHFALIMTHPNIETHFDHNIPKPTIRPWPTACSSCGSMCDRGLMLVYKMLWTNQNQGQIGLHAQPKIAQPSPGRRPGLR